MEVYFNDKKYDSMKELQKNYLRWLKKHEMFFSLAIKENGRVLFEGQFKSSENEHNIFEYVHKELMKNFKEAEKEGMYLEMQSIEYELDLIDGLYVMYFTEEKEMEVLLPINEPNIFVDYITDEECLLMSQKCAMHDIENDLSHCNYDSLVEEYMNLSAEQLVFEYERKYEEDYHIKYLDSLEKTNINPIIKRSILRSKITYKNLKQYYIQNNISLEMRKKV